MCMCVCVCLCACACACIHFEPQTNMRGTLKQKETCLALPSSSAKSNSSDKARGSQSLQQARYGALNSYSAKNLCTT